MKEISVLIVDDSLVIRNFVSRIVKMTPRLCVAAICENGMEALDFLLKNPADIIVCDIEMPVMGGIEFLKAKKKAGNEIPVIILSSLAAKGAKVTMQCLELGAIDFIQKPAEDFAGDLSSVAARLVEFLFAYGMPKKIAPKAAAPFDEAESRSIQGIFNGKAEGILPSPAELPAKNPVGKFFGQRIDVIGIGVSTGGPAALRKVLAGLSPKIRQPVLIVQHMPAGFTRSFAEFLDAICPLPVCEAADGEELQGGKVYIAKGDFHLAVARGVWGICINENQDFLRGGHRPSVDELFASLSRVFGCHVLAVIMTGMGRDGADEIASLCRLGAMTIAQDERTSVVYGMPKAACETGGIQLQLPLEKIAPAINDFALKFAK